MSDQDKRKRLAELSHEQRLALYERLQRKKAEQSPVHALPPLTRCSRTSGRFPLSFAQQRLWFLEQFEPGTALYNIPLALRIRGDVRPDLLERAFETLVARHEMLRTTFPTSNDEPVQVIAAPGSFQLPCIDLQSLSLREREARIAQLTDEEAQKPFDVSRDMPLRALLLRSGAHEHILLLTMHHIASDGWSMSICMREILALYSAYLQGQGSPLPDLPLQYVDFACWQRQWLQGAVLQEHLSYWKNRLANLPSLLLPTDHARPTVRTTHGALFSRRLEGDLLTRLNTLARREGVSLFMLLLAAFAVLLSRYTGAEDIPVGTAIANRNREELEGLIGFFVNTLVLRCDLSGEPSFHALLQRVREVCLEAYAHQDLPFEQLVDELQVKRDLSSTPLVQVQFLVQNTPRSRVDLQGLEVQPLVVSTHTAKFDVTFSLLGDEQAAFLEVEYNKDLFKEATIARMLGHFEILLQAIVRDATQAISSLPLLTNAERQQMLVQWNATEAEYPAHACIQHLFEAQAARTPEAPAVLYEAQVQTYRELDAAANRLAHYLRTLGVGPEVRVGVCLERALHMPAAILGILKAGGAYVPLDPSYPAERLAYMLADAGVSVLLIQQSVRHRLPTSAVRAVVLEHEMEQIEQFPGDIPPHSALSPENLAYVLYTSGSTGRPKGVMIPQRGLVHYAYWSSQYYEVAQGNGAPLHSSLSFDLTVTSLFPPLLVGRPVRLVREGQGGEELSSLLRQGHDFSLVKLTPAHLSMLSEQLQAQDLARTTRVLVVGGEALYAASVASWRIHAPATRIINEYGPTETVVGCCIYEMQPDSPKDGQVPIGRPIANTRLYVLNARLYPVPIGVAGELYIGGMGVARGYAQRPDLTAERFIPDPFSAQPGARLYRTGDLARYRADGILEFLGRNDQQVKIRGYRIELGEIEALLCRHAALKDALVLPWEEVQSGPQATQATRLLAYVVPQERPYSATSTVREDDARHLHAWQRFFERSYREASAQPEQAYEELERTAQRLLALRPEHVLEIGCGTGSLLLLLAPSCKACWGLDFSGAALDVLQQRVEQRGISNIHLLHGDAHDIGESLAAYKGFFDAIVLDGIIQYFPSLDYLFHVLEAAVPLLAPGGHLYIGGVRHLRARHAFYTLQQLQQAPLLLLTEQLQQRAQQQLSQDPELALDPAFFSALQRRLPQFQQVEIQLASGSAAAQSGQAVPLCYNVMLHLHGHERVLANGAAQPLSWREDDLSLSKLQQLLQEQQPPALQIDAIPNADMIVQSTLLEVLADEERPPRVGAIWEEVRRRAAHKSAITLQQIWHIEEIVPYTVSITCAKSGAIEEFDVRFVKQGSGSDSERIEVFSDEGVQQALAWRHYANQPVTRHEGEDISTDLMTYLKQQLPDYMVPAAIVVLDALPLTANGKVDRKRLPPPETKRPDLKSEFAAPRTTTESILAQIWGQVLGLEHIGIYDNFFELGGNSLLTIRIVARANQVGLRITTKQLFQHQTIAELAAIIGTHPILAEQGLVTGPQAFMPAHRNNLWPGMGDPACHSMAYIQEAPEPLNPVQVEAVVRHILFYHDALRLRAVKRGTEWDLSIAGMPQRLPYWFIDLSALSEVEQRSTLPALAMKLVLHFDLAQGPLFRVAFCYLGPHRPTPLIVVGHSMVVDMQSWQILLDDIQTAYRQISTQGTITFPPKTTSFQQWGLRLREYARSAAMQKELPYWLAEPRKHIAPLPMDYPAGANTGASMELVIALFTPEETQLLQQEIARMGNLPIDTLLLAAVAAAFRQWTRHNTQLISIEIHGREPIFDDMNLSRTIGTFPMDFPLLIELEQATHPGDIVRAVNRQVREVPQRGIGYAILRYLSEDPGIVEQIKALPQVQIHFNYLGTFLVPEVETSKVSGPYNGRIATAHLIERQWVSFLITSSIVDETLQMLWIYSNQQYEQETVKHVARAAKQYVKEFLAYLQTCKDGTQF